MPKGLIFDDYNFSLQRLRGQMKNLINGLPVVDICPTEEKEDTK